MCVSLSEHFSADIGILDLLTVTTVTQDFLYNYITNPLSLCRLIYGHNNLTVIDKLLFPVNYRYAWVHLKMGEKWVMFSTPIFKLSKVSGFVPIL